MKTTIKNIVKPVIISLLTLVIGFIAMSLPFNLFNSLEASQIRIVFLVEIIIYSIIFSMFFLVKEKKDEKQKQKKVEKLVKEKRRIQLLKDLEEFNMVA